ncbi:MAG: UvrABC system protein C [Candidatus Xenobia bacterium]
MSPLEVSLRSLPDAPGVYVMRDKQQRVLYVGKASSLKSRVRSYFQSGQDLTPRIRAMVRRVTGLETFVVASPMEALVLECNLIKQHRPYFNVKYRDDKRYPLLEVTTSETYPRLKLVRTRRNSKNRYFGPFPDAGALRRTMKILQNVFRIRTCKIPMTRVIERPCLDYYIELCTAPCTRFVTVEEYGRQVELALEFLEGHTDRLMGTLRQEMAEQARALQFEQAARLRNMLADLERVSEKQRVVLSEPEDEDYVALVAHRSEVGVQIMQVREGKLVGQHHVMLETHGEQDESAQMAAVLKQYYQVAGYLPRRILTSHPPEEPELLAEWLSQLRGRPVELRVPQRGDKKRLMELCSENGRQAVLREALTPSRFERRRKGLEELREALALEELPWRIECVDISNIQGKQAVGSLVAFEHGVPRRDRYRRFKIKTKDTPDDFWMMGEVLTRRFTAFLAGDPKFSELPDLLVVDGGKGQLGVARGVLERLELLGAVQLCALAKENEWLFVPGQSDPIVLARGTDGLAVVTHLRDEAHRFAITYHRKLRGQAFTRSSLESAPGIGKERREALLRYFGSLRKLQEAPVEELARVTGIGQRLAATLYAHLHPEEEAVSAGS